MVETVGKIAGTDQPELVDAFMSYVMSEDFQTVIPTANWSLPSALPTDQWPEGWAQLPLPEKVLFYSEEESKAVQEKAIETWRATLSQ